MASASATNLRALLACLGITALAAVMLSSRPAIRDASADTAAVDEQADGICPMLEPDQDMAAASLPAFAGGPAGPVLWAEKLMLMASTLMSGGMDDALLPRPPARYFQSLVVIDPSTTWELAHKGPAPPLHFRTVLAKLTGTPLHDLDNYVCNWAMTWLAPQTFSSTSPVTTPAAPRPLAAQSLWQAWKHDRIGLSAIVNRLDKAEVTDEGWVKNLGEIRLVYDLGAEDGNFQRFSLIVEMVPPSISPAPGLADDLQAWARAWQALETEVPYSPAYKSGLRNVVEMALRDGTEFHIRTNEEVEALWEFRQFEENGDSQLTPVRLPLTPDSYYADPNGGLRQYLGEVDRRRAAIVSGPYELPPPMLGNHVRHTPQQLPYLRNSQVDQARYVAAYNTCTGCHMQFAAGVARHIRRESHAGVPTVELSRFMTRTITLLAPMPECSRRTTNPGCTQGKPNEWTEYAKRIALLACYARADFACGRSDPAGALLH